MSWWFGIRKIEQKRETSEFLFNSHSFLKILLKVRKSLPGDMAISWTKSNFNLPFTIPSFKTSCKIFTSPNFKCPKSAPKIVKTFNIHLNTWPTLEQEAIIICTPHIQALKLSSKFSPAQTLSAQKGPICNKWSKNVKF